MRRPGASLAITVTILGVLAVAVPASGAGTSPGAVAAPKRWTARLAPPSDPVGHFDDVSCPSHGFCVAVGSAWFVTDPEHPGGAIKPLVETRTRTGWHLASTAGLPPSIDDLVRVDCSSRTMCIAIGHLRSRGPMRTVRWTGSKWVAGALPRPAVDHPVNVDCVTASFCMVVGTRDNLAWSWRWNGSRWISVATPRTRVRFHGVSCPTDRECFAVGRRIGHHGPPSRAVVSRWSGGKGWSLHDLPNGAPGSLADVDCVSGTSCTAVGASHDKVLVETFRGGAWRALRPHMPWASGTSSPAVSCRTGISCTAVVEWCCDGSGYHRWTFATRAPGGTWQARRTTRLSPPLTGVACHPTACIVVGGGPTNPLPYAVHAREAKPVREQVPAPPGPAGGVISDMSCTASGFCAGTTDGQRWPIVHRPGQPWRRTMGRGGHPSMNNVSCVSATFCMAAGPFRFEQWDGTRWIVLPKVANQPRTFSIAVSCVTATWCDAVGVGVIPGRDFVEHWDGSAWQVVRPRPTSRTLWDLSCTSTSACLAVGDRPERWDGSEWQPVPETGLPTQTSLGTVSCLSATECVVSYSTPVGPGVARWDGISFHPMTLAHVGGLVLRAVTCRSASACLAVGTSGSRGHHQAVVEAWDGHAWRLLAGPKIRYSHLFTVACSSNHCWAGGAQARGPRLPNYPILASVG